MLEVRVRFLRSFKTEPDFLVVTFQFCGFGEATVVGETVQNLQNNVCNVSTKLISKTKLVAKDFLNYKN